MAVAALGAACQLLLYQLEGLRIDNRLMVVFYVILRDLAGVVRSVASSLRPMETAPGNIAATHVISPTGLTKK